MDWLGGVYARRRLVNRAQRDADAANPRSAKVFVIACCTWVAAMCTTVRDVLIGLLDAYMWLCVGWARVFHEAVGPIAGGVIDLSRSTGRTAWNVFIVVVAVAIEIAWLGLVLSSVLGFVLIVAFKPRALLLPLGLLNYTVFDR